MDLISKYDLIEKIVRTDDQIILNQVKHLLEEEETQSWGTLNPALKKSIEKGLAQSRKGEVKPHSKIIKEIRKKYSK